MEEQGKHYLRRIAILSLWNKYHFLWELQPDVNIISGINGSGKSTLLNIIALVAQHLKIPDELNSAMGSALTIIDELALFVSNDIYKLNQITNFFLKIFSEKENLKPEFHHLVPDIIEFCSKYKELLTTSFTNNHTPLLEQLKKILKDITAVNSIEFSHIDKKMQDLLNLGIQLSEVKQNEPIENLLEKNDLTTDTLNTMFTEDGIYFYPEAPSPYIDTVSTFDQPLLHSDELDKLTGDNKSVISTELDLELYKLQEKYLNYQVNLGKLVSKAFSLGTKNADETVNKIFSKLNFFKDTINELFAETEKKLDEDNNKISFKDTKNDTPIYPHQLSSGEKQMLIILLKALIQDNQPAIMIMDEPEISLHVDWQRKLIRLIRELNPNVQLIIATHSPAMIMDGWGDKVFEMSDLLTEIKPEQEDNGDNTQG